jgi:hypothetical protein
MQRGFKLNSIGVMKANFPFGPPLDLSMYDREEACTRLLYVGT